MNNQYINASSEILKILHVCIICMYNRKNIYKEQESLDYKILHKQECVHELVRTFVHKVNIESAVIALTKERVLDYKILHKQVCVRELVRTFAHDHKVNIESAVIALSKERVLISSFSSGVANV